MLHRAHGGDLAKAPLDGRRARGGLLVVAHLDPKKRGSLEVQLCAVAGRLAAQDIATHFVFSHAPVAAVAAELDRVGATVEATDFLRPLVAARAVARAVRRLAPAIVHCHFLRATSLPVAAAGLGGARVVVNDHLALATDAVGVKRSVKHAWHWIGGALVDRRVPVSRFVARSIEQAEGAAPERVCVVENGVDLGRFAGVDHDAARRALGLDGDHQVGTHPVIACVARMAREKGVDVAIRAFARLAPRDRRATMLIAGDGPLAAECRGLAASLAIADRVRFLGLRDDVERVLAAADQAWVPSRAEAFGLAAVEAMAAGLPVVAARAGALDEVVVDGATGLLVPPDDDAALAAAAAALLDDPERARRLGAAGRARVHERFSLDGHVDRVVALYRQLAPAWCLG